MNLDDLIRASRDSRARYYREEFHRCELCPRTVVPGDVVCKECLAFRSWEGRTDFDGERRLLSFPEMQRYFKGKRKNRLTR